MISKELLDKFKKLYLQQFEITLSDEDATKMTTDLVNLIKILASSPYQKNNETYLEGKKIE